jgi:hypothetical protein
MLIVIVIIYAHTHNMLVVYAKVILVIVYNVLTVLRVANSVVIIFLSLLVLPTSVNVIIVSLILTVTHNVVMVDHVIVVLLQYIILVTVMNAKLMLTVIHALLQNFYVFKIAVSVKIVSKILIVLALVGKLQNVPQMDNAVVYR